MSSTAREFPYALTVIQMHVNVLRYLTLCPFIQEVFRWLGTMMKEIHGAGNSPRI